MYGAIIGDLAGSVYEYELIKQVNDKIPDEFKRVLSKVYEKRK